MNQNEKESWWQEVRAVFTKDVRSELRTKSAIAAILIFSLTTMVLVSFTVDTLGPGLTQWWVEEEGRMVLRTVNTRHRAELLSTLYWIILFFSAMAGLPRVFVKEEEMRTAAALRLAARPSAVYAGKLLFNVILIEGVTLLLLPLFVLFFQPVVVSSPVLLSHLIIGAAAMAGTATILGAIVARSGNRGYLMLPLGFGPLLPILYFAIDGTTTALHGTGGNNLVVLVSYLVVMVLVSGPLFEKVWRD